MSVYFIRKSGSDSNAGTSAGAAWLTIGKALTTVVSGDTVYIGAGVYRETVTVTITPISETKIIGDINGAQTGDPGEIRWTDHITDDRTVPSTAAILNLNGKN